MADQIAALDATAADAGVLASELADGVVRAPLRLRPAVRAVLYAAGLLAVAVSVLAVSLAVFRDGERDRAGGRLLQHRATLAAEVERFTHLPFILADDEAVVAASRGRSAPRLNERLAAFADEAGLEAIYVMNADGLTVAASNHDRPGTFLGQRYDFRPYFQTAMGGGTGTFFGVGATTKRPGYFVAMPVVDGGEPVGVVAVKLSLGELERSWAASEAALFVTDDNGVVLLASNPDWRYRTLSTLAPERVRAIRGSRQFDGADLRPFEREADDGTLIPDDAGAVFHLAAGGLPHGWTLHYLADDWPARLKAWVAVASVMAVLTVALLVAQHRRTGRVRTALGASREEERLLRVANDRLAVEVQERRAAEQRLEAAQDELRRASRLAALGQLAASVSHELSQPIAAMRNHLMADELQRRAADAAPVSAAPKSRGILRLPHLVDRMEGITRQLKFFAKPGDGMMSAVDLRDAVEEALSLVEPNASAVDAEIDVDLPDGAVRVRGNKLRIEQVFVNLLRNGIDAVAEADERRVDIGLRRDGADAVVTIADSGPGFGERSVEELAEPFVTTRASGEGLGLGLAISREIVREHGGGLNAWNAQGDGAVFEVRLPLAGRDG